MKELSQAGAVAEVLGNVMTVGTVLHLSFGMEHGSQSLKLAWTVRALARRLKNGHDAEQPIDVDHRGNRSVGSAAR